MSVNIDIRGEGVRPTLKTSRMSVYLSDTGIRLLLAYYYGNYCMCMRVCITVMLMAIIISMLFSFLLLLLLLLLLL